MSDKKRNFAQENEYSCINKSNLMQNYQCKEPLKSKTHTVLMARPRYKLSEFTIIYNSILMYKSDNMPKFTGFIIFKTQDMEKGISILNDFLSKRIIKYYSIHINIKNDLDKIFIVCLECNKNSNTSCKYEFKQIRIMLTKEFSENSINIFENESLREKFLSILEKYYKKYQNSPRKEYIKLITADKKEAIILPIITINLANIEQKNNFFNTFADLLKSKDQNGHLVFNFSIEKEKDQINVIGYFINDYINTNELVSFISAINRAFQIDLLEIYERPTLGKILWRTNLEDVKITHETLFENLKNIFISKEWSEKKDTKITGQKDKSENLQKKNEFEELTFAFEKTLKKKKFEYYLVPNFKKNAYFLESSKFIIYFLNKISKTNRNELNLFLSFLAYLYKNKYNKSHHICIVTIDENDCNKLSQLKKRQENRNSNFKALQDYKIENLKSIKIMSKEEFIKAKIMS